ncbi:MHYT domain-containing protein [Deinococcus sonorensis]|uniref:MHYT domain-containing protein n=2 Tax=Deinococcus sonorensis TaxID=309891 RepID=A0AAU7UA06_9DEIO
MTDAMLMSHSWNPFYIVLSFVIASVTSYLSLELARDGDAQDRTRRQVGQGLLLGYGIWAMHFVGMLAFQVPVGLSFNVPLTVVSGLVSVAFLVAAVMFLNRGPQTLVRIIASGTIAGTGIVLMHYSGMAAMQVDAVSRYVALPFLLSVLIAVSAASVAFYLFSRVMTTRLDGPARLAIQGGAALVMGVAIVGMHYTGMAAVQYSYRMSPMVGSPLSEGGADQSTLGMMVGGASVLVFVCTFALILADSVGRRSALTR